MSTPQLEVFWWEITNSTQKVAGPEKTPDQIWNGFLLRRNCPQTGIFRSKCMKKNYASTNKPLQRGWWFDNISSMLLWSYHSQKLHSVNVRGLSPPACPKWRSCPRTVSASRKTTDPWNAFWVYCRCHGTYNLRDETTSSSKFISSESNVGTQWLMII